MNDALQVPHDTPKGRRVTLSLLHGVDFEGRWYSAHDRRGRTLAAAASMDEVQRQAPHAASYRERDDRGLDDRWAPAPTGDLFPDHAGGTLF